MSLPDTSVKVYTQAMPGAPSIASGAAGQFLPVLDACLVNGFGSVTVDSLTVSGNLATVFVSTGHGISMIGSGDEAVGPVIAISGATPAALNGEWRVASVTNANTLAFATEGIADTTATGTIELKRAPLGWTKPYSDTNIAAYRNDSVLGTGIYLRIDNTGTDDARPQTYRTMSGINTGTDGSAQPYWRFHGTTTPSQWCIIGDARAFYVMMNGPSGYWVFNYFAGDLADSAVPMDACNFLLLGYSSATDSQTNQLVNPGVSNSNHRTIAGAADQLNGPQDALVWAHRAAGSYSGQGVYGFTSLSTSSLLMAPRLIESNDSHRGHLPGLFDPLCYTAGKIPDYTTFMLPDDPRRYLYKDLDYWIGDVGLVFDITGPWRSD